MKTMTDREMLELAAKAAGLIDVGSVANQKGFYTMPREIEAGRALLVDDNGIVRMWKPILDDGDALRLAVKLRLSVDTYMDASSRFDTDERCTIVVLPRPSENSVGEWHGESDPYKATRRGIVRAAALIGKAMP